jgi:low temperature requirement protein LtrA
MAAIVAGLSNISWSFLPTLTAALSVGIVTALWWLYFDNTSGSVVRRDAAVRRTWRPTGWIYTHLVLAAALASSAVGLERAVSEAGDGPMPGTDRWLLVGSVIVVLAALALIQFASTFTRSPGRHIIFTRLTGIPFLVLVGFLSALEAQWVVVGVVGICAAQLVVDMTEVAPGD